jgi:hypothetical protein
MILIDDTVISEDVADEFFVCDLAKCKGACCVEGDLGAPLEEEELAIIELPNRGLGSKMKTAIFPRRLFKVGNAYMPFMMKRVI